MAASTPASRTSSSSTSPTRRSRWATCARWGACCARAAGRRSRSRRTRLSTARAASPRGCAGAPRRRCGAAPGPRSTPPGSARPSRSASSSAPPRRTASSSSPCSAPARSSRPCWRGVASLPAMTALDAPALRAEVARYPWYHTLELAPGVATPGMFDHRPHLDHYPLPADLSGKRCLDVGTMDGFWAFEMERRGAAEVTAIDVADPDQLDWPASLRATHGKTMDETKEARFALAHERLGSKVRRVELSVYDLSLQLGTFDVVFCGDLLLHLRDPVRAVENLRSVCGELAVIANPIARFGLLDRGVLATFDGVDEFVYWTTNLAGLVRLVRSGGFTEVVASKPFKVPFRDGTWKGLRGVV